MTTTFRFEIDGPLHGYRAGLTRVWDPKYKAFKEHVRLVANTHGVPDEVLDRQKVGIATLIYWKRRARIDGSNILKAVEDALFRQDRGLAWGNWQMHEHQGREYVEVVIEAA